MEELGAAEKLIAEAEKNGSLSDEGVEGEKPASEVKAEAEASKKEVEAGVEGEKKPGENAEQKQEIVDYMAQAIERAKLELKHKTSLTDAEINNHIAQRFLTAGGKIQRLTETQKALQQALGDVDPKTVIPLRDYYQNMEESPIVKAFRANKNFKVVKGQLYEIPDEEDFVEETPEMKKLSALEKRLDGVLSATERKEAEAEKRRVEEQSNARAKELGAQIDKETKALTEKYPTFKTWMKQSETQGYLPPELEEIFDTVKRDGVTLTYAVKAYFADHGLPSALKKAKEEAVNELKDKAGQRSERGAAAGESRREIKYHDERSVAEALVAEAGF